MKKHMLCAGLMAILSIAVYAKESDKSVNVKSKQTAATSAKAQKKQTSGAKLASKKTPTHKKGQVKTSDSEPIPAPSGIQTPTDKGTAIPSTPNQPLPSSTPAPSTSMPAPVPGGQSSIDGTITTADASERASATNTQAPATLATNKPTAAPTSTLATSTPAPTTGTPAPAGATPSPGTAAPIGTPNSPSSPPQPQNCSYRIPAETTHVEQAVVMKWAEKAAEQSFDFDHAKIDNQLSALKTCFTEQGWVGFNDALQKSGNLSAIKSQKLSVSSMINGESKISELKDNQWKVIIPMQVVYQNDKEKLTQPLTINLIVGRKVSGDLGIMQMIAIPQQTTKPTTQNETPNAAAPAASTPPSTKQ